VRKNVIKRLLVASASEVVVKTNNVTRIYIVTEDSTTLIDQRLDVLGRVNVGCTIALILTIFREEIDNRGYSTYN